MTAGVRDGSDRHVVPIFVLGVPRSGTTLIGAYVGSSTAVLHLGEYAGLYLAFGVGPQLCVADRLAGKPASPFVRQYLQEVQDHALRFPFALAAGGPFDFWCDSSPVNLTIVEVLTQLLPDAVYVLTVRRHEGVLPSLERCYGRGEFWAGATWEQRAHLWKRSYEKARLLPLDRTVVISYDMLSRSPRPALDGFKDDLARFGVPTASLDEAVFATSWATEPDAGRPTIARLDDDGSPCFRSVDNAHPVPWSPEIDRGIIGIVEPTRQFLRSTFIDIAEYL